MFLEGYYGDVSMLGGGVVEERRTFAFEGGYGGGEGLELVFHDSVIGWEESIICVSSCALNFSRLLSQVSFNLGGVWRSCQFNVARLIVQSIILRTAANLASTLIPGRRLKNDFIHFCSSTPSSNNILHLEPFSQFHL